MKSKRVRIALLSALLLLIVACVTGYLVFFNCYGFDQFADDLRNRNYVFEVKDKGVSDFPPASKENQIISDQLNVSVYLLSSSLEMEEVAKGIFRNGVPFQYLQGDRIVQCFPNWVSEPHFFKKGKIIVLYVGKDQRILND